MGGRGRAVLNKLFIAVGGLVIAVLFTALIGPYLVNWTAYAENFERQASAYVGRPVSIEGKASVRLLPTPVLSFTDIRIGDREAPELQMERFRAEVELAPLLKGEIRIIHMVLERPRFSVDIAGLAQEGAGALDRAWKIDPQRVSLARLEVVEGTATIDDSRSGKSWQANDIDALIEAGSLRGPGKIEANLILEGRPMGVRIGLGRFGNDDTVATKVSVSTPLYPLTLSTDGTLTLGKSEPPSYKGAVTLAGIAPAEGEPRTPWADFRAEGDFELTPEAFTVEEAQIAYGAMERPLVLEGEGGLDLRDEPRFDIALRARQIDIDRALGGGADAPVSVETALAALLRAAHELPRPSLPGALRLDAQGLVIGGSVVQAVGLDVEPTADGWKIADFAAMLPGETRVDVQGALRTSEALAFQGHGRVKSARPSAFASWWRGQVGSAAELKSFALGADLDLEPSLRRFSNIAATTGDGTVRGSVEFRRFQQSGELFATVNLNADRADLAEARALTELLTGQSLWAGRVDQMTLSLRADVLAARGIEARSVVVDGGVEDGRLQLNRLSIADLAGAEIEARGEIKDPLGVPSGRLEASVKAEDISGAAEFLAGLVPGNALAAHLVDRAPALAPIQADVSAEIGGAGEPLSLDLSGSFADTHVTLTASGRGSLAEPESLNGKLTLHVDGEDSAGVLAQLGLEPLPVRAGPLTLDADFDGAVASGGTLKAEGSVAGIRFGYNAETSMRDGLPAAAGRFEAESIDTDPALLLAGIALPGVGEGHAAAAEGRLEIGSGRLSFDIDKASFDGRVVRGSLQAELGDAIAVGGALELDTVSLPLLAAFAVGQAPTFGAGGWSDAPFSAALPPGLALDLSLKAAELDLGLPIPATDAALDLEASAGTLNIDLAQAELGGGTLKGAIAATLADGEAQTTIRGTLERARLETLGWYGRSQPVASGLADASFDVSGHGRSAAGIASTLSGTGSFALSEARLNTLNPQALAAVIEAIDPDKEPDETVARETFASQFGAAAFPFGQAAGSFSVADGVINVPTVSLAAGATTVMADGTVDLNSLSLASDWSLRGNAPGGSEEPQPFVRVLFRGPVGEPERRVDLNPLLEVLRARYLQRQLDRIEELEAARRRAEAAARALSVPQPGAPRRPVPTPAAAALPQDTEAQAAPGDAPTAAAPTPPVGAAPTDAAPAEPEPPVIQQLAPAMQDLLGEGAREGRPLVPPASGSGARTANGTVDRGAQSGAVTIP